MLICRDYIESANTIFTSDKSFFSFRIDSGMVRMLSVFEYLITPCPKHIKAMGYLFEAMGIQDRYRRCAKVWEPHLQKTREVILDGMNRCQQHRKAILIGAGLLHDLPLEELSKTFREVVLVDIVHPLRHRYRTWKYKNVTRLRLDITDTVREVYRLSEDDRYPLPTRELSFFLNDRELDFTASINLLSQLPCMPMAYLISRKVHPKTAIDAYATNLIRNHLAWLSRLPGQVTLVTDFERIQWDADHHRVNTIDILYGQKPTKPAEEWEWNLAPLGEVNSKVAYTRQVLGIADWKG
jgi:hypothetical protein